MLWELIRSAPTNPQSDRKPSARKNGRTARSRRPGGCLAAGLLTH